LLRAANDGVSAVVGQRGEVLAAAREYEPIALRSSVVPRQGHTPWMQFTNIPVVACAAVALALAALIERRRRRMRAAS
jgi:apolipoprotein N-acyltransferase